VGFGRRIGADIPQKLGLQSAEREIHGKKKTMADSSEQLLNTELRAKASCCDWQTGKQFHDFF
jgi:hypothetical protein